MVLGQKTKSYHHPTKNPNFFCNMKLFFSVQLGHLKLSGYGLLSTQGVQNRSQNCWIVSQSEVMLQYMRDPGAPAASRTKRVLIGIRTGAVGCLPRKRAPRCSQPRGRGRRWRVCGNLELGVDAPSAPACIRERSRALPVCDHRRE